MGIAVVKQLTSVLWIIETALPATMMDGGKNPAFEEEKDPVMEKDNILDKRGQRHRHQPRGQGASLISPSLQACALTVPLVAVFLALCSGIHRKNASLIQYIQ